MTTAQKCQPLPCTHIQLSPKLGCKLFPFQHSSSDASFLTTHTVASSRSILIAPSSIFYINKSLLDYAMHISSHNFASLTNLTLLLASLLTSPPSARIPQVRLSSSIVAHKLWAHVNMLSFDRASFAFKLLDSRRIVDMHQHGWNRQHVYLAKHPCIPAKLVSLRCSTYSASIVDRETTPCFFALQLTDMSFSSMTQPVSEFRSFLSSAKSTSLYDSSMGVPCDPILGVIRNFNPCIL